MVTGIVRVTDRLVERYQIKSRAKVRNRASVRNWRQVRSRIQDQVKSKPGQQHRMNTGHRKQLKDQSAFEQG